MVAPWPRENYVAGGGPAQIALIALSSAKLPDPLPVSRARHGMPDHGDGAESIALVARDRADDPTWFANQVLAPFTELIVSDLGPDAAATVLAAEHAYVIEAQLDDPDDLGHLQAAWALAKCVCEEGAAVVIDVYAARAHLGSEVAAMRADRSFDVMHEVTLFFEEEPAGTLAAWSLGLKKFGRPDLVVLGVRADEATEAALLLRDIAATLASGERIEPGDSVGAPGGRTLVAERFDPAHSAAVAVDGDAILLR
ncbi:MAG: hypothetical protein H0T89_08920 [Deltaproteobacteria bacterium]|nr:hypothetical protein [Deltaproteobacteria bacterium]MDQ3297366.1 DUF4261 domain-containing protein [Myxococcota bacterium]